MVAALVGPLGDSNSYVREAAYSLGQPGQVTPEVASALADALADSDSAVREAAAGSLGQLGQATPKVVAALIGALGHNNSYARGAAASNLVQLEQATPEVVAGLNRSLHDSNRGTYIAAHEALSKLFDGKPLPGDEWGPLRERRDKSKRKLRCLPLILLALVIAFVSLAYLLAALYVH